MTYIVNKKKILSGYGEYLFQIHVLKIILIASGNTFLKIELLYSKAFKILEKPLEIVSFIDIIRNMNTPCIFNFPLVF